MTSHERNDDAIVASGTSDAVRKMVRRFVQDDVPAGDEEQAILVLEEEPACVRVAAYRRLRVRFFAGVVAGPAVHASTISFVAFVIAVAAWRFACPTAWPRSEPAAALAPLSHMLMNGFFFNHGLAILISLDSEAVQAFGLMGGDAARVSLPVIPRLVKPVGYDRRHLGVPAHRAQPRPQFEQLGVPKK